ARSAPERADEKDLVGEIEGSGRLVEDEQRRLLREGAGEEHALPLSTRQLRDGAVRQIERVHFRERRGRPGEVVGPLEGPEPEVGGPTHERHLPRPHRRLRMSRTNSGAPTIAVTAPTGGSAPRPRKSTRARASARTRKAAPPKAEAGSTTR